MQAGQRRRGETNALTSFLSAQARWNLAADDGVKRVTLKKRAESTKRGDPLCFPDLILPTFGHAAEKKRQNQNKPPN